MEYPIFKSKDSEDLFKDFFMKKIDVIENYYLNLELKDDKIVRKRKYNKNNKNNKNKFTNKDMVNLVNVYIIPKLYLYYANMYMDFSHNYEYYYNIYYASYSSILNLKNIYFSKENPLNKRINIMIKENEDVIKKNVAKNYDIYKFIYEEKEQVNNYLGHVSNYVDKLLAEQEKNKAMIAKKKECNTDKEAIKNLLLSDLRNIHDKLSELHTKTITKTINDVKTKFDDFYKSLSNNSIISNIPEIIKLLSMSEKDIYDEIKIFLDALETNYYDYKSKESECELLGNPTEDTNEYNKLKENIQQYIEKSNDIKDFISEYSNSKNNNVKQSKKERIKKLIDELFGILKDIIDINNSPILEPIFLIIYEITLFETHILKGGNTNIDIKDTITRLNEDILSSLKDSDRGERKKSQEKQIDSLKKRQGLEKEKKSLEDKKGKLESDLQKYIQKNPIDDTIQKQIDTLRRDIETKQKQIDGKEININRNRITGRPIERLLKEVETIRQSITDLEKKINALEIQSDQKNRTKIQYQKNLYERPIRLLEIKIDSIDKSIKDIDEKSKNSGQTDMIPISNAEKDYFNYVINFINVATSGKDTKNIIQRMFENNAIVRIYNDPNDQIKKLKIIPFFKKQDESFFNFFQRGGANSSPEPFTETVKKYMLDIKKVNTFYVDAYFNYLARVNKEFNIYIQQLFLRLDSAMKTEVDYKDLCDKLESTNKKLKIIIGKIRGGTSVSISKSFNNSDYTKNLYPYTDFILAYFMILVYFINLLIMEILGCSPTSPVASSSGSPVANSTESLPPGISTIICNEIKIYVREEDYNIIDKMIKRIKSIKLNKSLTNIPTESLTKSPNESLTKSPNKSLTNIPTESLTKSLTTSSSKSPNSSPKQFKMNLAVLTNAMKRLKSKQNRNVGKFYNNNGIWKINSYDPTKEEYNLRKGTEQKKIKSSNLNKTKLKNRLPTSSTK